MKNRIIKGISCVLAAAMLVTGTGFYAVEKVQAEVYGNDGYDVNGYDRDGYDRNGYDVNGYDRNGYDVNGYDRDGYDRNGYDRNGYDRDGYPWDFLTPTGNEIFSLLISTDKKWTLDVERKKEKGEEDDVSCYRIICKKMKPEQVLKDIKTKINKAKKDEYKTVSIDSVATKKGYGQYKITVQYGKKYKDAVKTIDLTIFPYFETRCSRFNKNKILTKLVTTKDAAKYMDGVEYKLTQGITKKLTTDYDTGAPIPAVKEKVMKKGSRNIKNLKFESRRDSKLIATDLFWAPKMKNGKNWLICHNYARVYIVVDGKKIYSSYKEQYSYISGKL